jgi:hypothetical protein
MFFHARATSFSGIKLAPIIAIQPDALGLHEYHTMCISYGSEAGRLNMWCYRTQ